MQLKDPRPRAELHKRGFPVWLSLRGEPRLRHLPWTRLRDLGHLPQASLLAFLSPSPPRSRPGSSRTTRRRVGKTGMAGNPRVTSLSSEWTRAVGKASNSTSRPNQRDLRPGALVHLSGNRLDVRRLLEWAEKQSGPIDATAEREGAPRKRPDRRRSCRQLCAPRGLELHGV